jgi:hypothetical protein
MNIHEIKLPKEPQNHSKEPFSRKTSINFIRVFTFVLHFFNPNLNDDEYSKNVFYAPAIEYVPGM